MVLEFKFPDSFYPSRSEFRLYCAVVMRKDRLITEEEAAKMCGMDKEEFKKAKRGFIERFRRLAGEELTDEYYKSDKDYKEKPFEDIDFGNNKKQWWA